MSGSTEVCLHMLTNGTLQYTGTGDPTTARIVCNLYFQYLVCILAASVAADSGALAADGDSFMGTCKSCVISTQLLLIHGPGVCCRASSYTYAPASAPQFMLCVGCAKLGVGTSIAFTIPHCDPSLRTSGNHLCAHMAMCEVSRCEPNHRPVAEQQGKGGYTHGPKTHTRLSQGYADLFVSLRREHSQVLFPLWGEVCVSN